MARREPGDGTILRELRIKTGKSVADIALELGVSTTVPRKWELGDEWISEPRVPAVCKAYGCEVADIHHLVNWRPGRTTPAAPPAAPTPAALEGKQVGAFLRAKREQLRITSPGMAKLIGVSDASISNWETGRHRISPRIVPAILHRYGIEREDIAAIIRPSPAGVPAIPRPRRQKKPKIRGHLAVVPAERARLPETRPQGPPPEGAPLPAEVRIGVQLGGRIVMSATWQPGTEEGNRMANMTAEMLVNIR